MNKLLSALVSFAIVFICVFMLCGWFVMPHLPSVPEIPPSMYEPQFWLSNWAGIAMGLGLGLISARSVMKKKKTVKYK